MIRIATLAIALALPAAASAAVVVENATIRPTIGNQGTSAAYMTLRNTGPTTDRLVDASCACADSVMAHRTFTEKGVSRMQMEMRVGIPAKDTLVFDARGRHLMLTGVKRPIKAGDRIPITLIFEKAGKVTAQFTADNLAGMTTGDHQHAH